MRIDLEELLNSAEEDFRASKTLFDSSFFRVACFHAHQCVEKLLKAFLLHSTGEYPFTHSIAWLIDLCVKIDKGFERLYEINADKLDKYYTQTRYPPLLKVTQEEAKEALKLAEEVREFVLKKLDIGKR